MPIVAGPSLVYIHMPKTAGTWISTFLARQGIADFETIKKHYPRGAHGHYAAKHCYSLHEGRTVFGSVRNPFDWYVSYYVTFARVGLWKFLECWTNTPQPGFKRWVQAATWGPFPAISPKGLQPHPIELPLPEGLYSLLPPEMDWLDAGFYSWMHHRSYTETISGKSLVDRFVHAELLPDSLVEPLVDIGAMDRHDAAWLDPINCSVRKPTWTWYDPESRQWVAERDTRLLLQFGYAFPDRRQPTMETPTNGPGR